MNVIKSAVLRTISSGWGGRRLSFLGQFLRAKPTVLGFTNPFHMSHVATAQAGNIYLSHVNNYIALQSGRRKMIKFDPALYEPEVTFLIQSLISKNDNILDVGANIGFHTITMAKAAYPGHLYAFEPVSEMANQNSLNCALNRLDNVSIIECALGDKSSEMEMQININGIGMEGTSTLLQENVHVSQHPENYSSRKVKIHRLDDIIENLDISGRIGFIKIDTEGFDALVLDGAMKTIKKHKPIMIVEAHSKRLEQTGKSWKWYLDSFPAYHVCIISPLTEAKPYLHLEPLTPDQPEISVNLLLLPRTHTVTPKL